VRRIVLEAEVSSIEENRATSKGVSRTANIGAAAESSRVGGSLDAHASRDGSAQLESTIPHRLEAGNNPDKITEIVLVGVAWRKRV